MNWSEALRFFLYFVSALGGLVTLMVGIAFVMSLGEEHPGWASFITIMAVGVLFSLIIGVLS